MSLSDKSLEVANALLATTRSSYSEKFNVAGNDEEEVVVMAVRIKKGMRKTALFEWGQRIQFQDSGAVCPACSGTGRL